MKKVAIIIPTLNEAQNIKQTIQKVLASPLVSLVVVVDDSSKDATVKIVQNLQKSNTGSKIILLERQGPRNFSQSYNEGFKKAIQEGADILIQMDADGSHDAKYLKEIIHMMNKYDFVIGSRYIKGGGIDKWSKSRKLLSKGANLYAKILLNLPYRDVTSGYNAWRSEVIKSIDFSKLTNKGYVFQTWLKWNAHRKGYKGKEVPIIFTERKFGKSKMHYRMIFESFYEIFMLALKKYL